MTPPPCHIPACEASALHAISAACVCGHVPACGRRWFTLDGSQASSQGGVCCMLPIVVTQPQPELHRGLSTVANFWDRLKLNLFAAGAKAPAHASTVFPHKVEGPAELPRSKAELRKGIRPGSFIDLLVWALIAGGVVCTDDALCKRGVLELQEAYGTPHHVYFCTPLLQLGFYVRGDYSQGLSR